MLALLVEAHRVVPDGDFTRPHRRGVHDLGAVLHQRLGRLRLGAVIGQLKDFFGLTYPSGTATVETLDKASALAANFGTFNWQALVVGAVCLAVLFL